MPKKVKVSLKAQNDLLNIGKYTKDKWGTDQRNKYLREISKCFNYISKHPQSGISRPEIKQEYYSYLSRNHVIFYIILDNGVFIISVLHQSMDIQKHL